MNSEIENKTGREAATKVGGMRVPAHDHSVPVIRKEHERKLPAEKEAEEEMNDEERELVKNDKLEYEKQTRLAAGEHLARMQENQPKHDAISNNPQSQNIQVNQPIRHNHNKSGSAAQH